MNTINELAVEASNLRNQIIDKLQVFHDAIYDLESKCSDDEGLHYRVFEVSCIRLADYDEFKASLTEEGVEYIFTYFVPYEDYNDTYSIFIKDEWDLSDPEAIFEEMLEESKRLYELDESKAKEYARKDIERIAAQNDIKLTIHDGGW